MGVHEIARCVFLDRDGVLNEPVVRNGRPYPPPSLEEFKLYDDVALGCARLKAAGFLLVVVTNQPDVGRGTQTRALADAMNARLKTLLPMIDRIEVCFHAGERHGEVCGCRKPKAGMLFQAAAALQIDITRSFLIGDRWRDIDCARNSGCGAIFISRDYAEEMNEAPDVTVRTFSEAVTYVLNAH